MLERFEDWWHADRDHRQQALLPLIERIEQADHAVQAWVQVVPQFPTGDGPLSDIPFGVKDVIETAHLATEFGSPLYKGRIGTADADIVRRLRMRGAVLVGKTETCAFACRTPARTKNPRNLSHTPGGSSAGSAAAVAADMVPLAIGTQTHGSVIRPASFCGVTGFKPTYGLLSMEGVLPVARTLDTLGFFTHTAVGMRLFWQALTQPLPPAAEAVRTEAWPAPVERSLRELVVAVPEPALEVDGPMADAFARTVAFLRHAGMTVQPAPITPLLSTMPRENRIVEYYEGARTHEARFREFGDRLGDVAEMVREGLRIPPARYDAALAVIAECRSAMEAQFAVTPIVLTPAATGYAPEGYAFTGDARMNSPWTALGTPAVTIPMPVGRAELPLGLQLTAAGGEDDRLLQVATAIEAVLRPGVAAREA